MAETEKPNRVTLTVENGYVLLTVSDITPGMFGNYTVTSENRVGDATSTALMLTPERKLGIVFEILRGIILVEHNEVCTPKGSGRSSSEPRAIKKETHKK